MKKRLFALMAAFALVISVSVLPAAAGDTDGISTDSGDMKLSGNCGGNCVKGNGTNHSPGRSWLYANEKGGVTLVQYVSAQAGVTAAEFDSALNFVNTRSIPVEGIKKWGGFYAGEKYNYIVYANGSNTLRIDQYGKDWGFVNTKTYTIGNTNSLISNDLDITGSSGSLYIVSNHTMSDGHQANFRLQVSAETLSLMIEQSGSANYFGYCSHSFVPEVAYSGGTVYTFDRSESYPGAGLYMNVFGGGFSSGSSTRLVKSMRFNDWGSQGNAIPAAGNGVLTAYTFANWNQANTLTDAYLYYASSTGSSTQARVSTTGGAGTPYVAAITDSYGYVLWNTDFYDRTQERDNLYYAVYTLNSGNITVGPIRKAENHYLSDCEPIQWDGGLLWFTYASGELSFHQISAAGKVSKNVKHDPVAVEGTPATCAATGLTDGVTCSLCKEALVEQAVLEKLPHTEEAIYVTGSDCTQSGLSDGIQCSVCSEVLKAPEKIIEPLSHTKVKVPGTPASCTATGLADGEKCSACETVLVKQEILEKLAHTEVKTEYVAPTFTSEGYTEGIKCDVCQTQLSGHEEIPKLKAGVKAVQIENGKLSVNYQINHTAFVTVAYYDENDRCVGAKTNTVFAWGKKTTFSAAKDSHSYRVFMTDVYWSPLCDVYSGTV